MSQMQLHKNLLDEICQARDIAVLSLDEIKMYFLSESKIAAYAPDGYCQIDPRNGDRIIFNTARARRPHDNLPKQAAGKQETLRKECLICQGKTTQILDVAPLSEGFTFINKNLFPIFYPQSHDEISSSSIKRTRVNGRGTKVEGYHFLQWSSSVHDKDWHNMPLDDRVIVIERLAALEKKMTSINHLFVSIIKNYGHLVGGSLVHGHQQITASNVMPNRFVQDKKFQEDHREAFSRYMLNENPDELIIKDYGPAILLTPYFMRRPFDMFLVLKDSKKAYFHQLDDKEIAAVADGWRDAIRIMNCIMPRIGKEVAYNVTTHNCPGTGLYFEFLPYTQEMGGFEHLGLFLCQGNPLNSAQTAREML